MTLTMPGSDAQAERPPVRFAGSSAVPAWQAMEYARVLGLANPLYSVRRDARAAGHRDVLVPETQLFLACRAHEGGEPPREATGLPEGFGSVVTGIRSEYRKPVEADQPFTVRVRRLPSEAEPTKRVAAFHVVEYELTDVEGDVAARLWLTVAELRT